jgi:hypothetical protein
MRAPVGLLLLSAQLQQLVALVVCSCRVSCRLLLLDVACACACAGDVGCRRLQVQAAWQLCCCRLQACRVQGVLCAQAASTCAGRLLCHHSCRAADGLLVVQRVCAGLFYGGARSRGHTGGGCVSTVQLPVRTHATPPPLPFLVRVLSLVQPCSGPCLRRFGVAVASCRLCALTAAVCAAGHARALLLQGSGACLGRSSMTLCVSASQATGAGALAGWQRDNHCTGSTSLSQAGVWRTGVPPHSFDWLRQRDPCACVTAVAHTQLDAFHLHTRPSTARVVRTRVFMARTPSTHARRAVWLDTPSSLNQGNTLPTRTRAPVRSIAPAPSRQLVACAWCVCLCQKQCICGVVGRAAQHALMRHRGKQKQTQHMWLGAHVVCCGYTP